MLHGATGPNSAHVNGTYVLTAERLNGKPVYAKVGDADRWLFVRTDGKWRAGATSKELTDNAESAGNASSEADLAHPAAAKAWQVWDDSKWNAQPVEVSILVRVRTRVILRI